MWWHRPFSKENDDTIPVIFDRPKSISPLYPAQLSRRCNIGHQTHGIVCRTTLRVDFKMG